MGKQRGHGRFIGILGHQLQPRRSGHGTRAYGPGMSRVGFRA
jgi:hypothetical protein